MIQKIISGEQTGVDIAALRAAKRAGIATGGKIPRGFRTATGNKPEYAHLYSMTETESRDYPERTESNARDSDLTLLLANNLSSTGSITTRHAAQKHNKRLVQVDLFPGSEDDITDTLKRLRLQVKLRNILIEHDVKVLNVAGNRDVGLEKLVEEFLVELFEGLRHYEDLAPMFAREDRAVEAVRVATGGKWGRQGTIPCPNCGNTLSYLVSDINGHTHGKCATAGCCDWKQ